jgi:DnaD/phage-associated family protein
MNYLKELNAFYDWLESNPCSTGVVALWYTLMALNNRTGWKDEFTAANLTLQAKTGLSRQQLDRCRSFLISKGRIQYEKSRRVNQAGKYSIVKFESRDESPHESRGDTRDESPNGHDLTTLFKQKETKQNIPVIDQVTRDLHRAYEQLFGRPPNPVQLDDLHEYTDKGMELELVIHAVKTARLNNAGIKYATRILDRQFDAGIKTIAQAEQEEAERQTAAGGTKIQMSVSAQKNGGKPPDNKQDPRYKAFYALYPDS